MIQRTYWHQGVQTIRLALQSRLFATKSGKLPSDVVKWTANKFFEYCVVVHIQSETADGCTEVVSSCMVNLDGYRTVSEDEWHLVVVQVQI